MALKAQLTFTQEELIAIVKNYHPVAKQAQLDVSIAEANVTASRGAFDPLVSLDKSRKELNGSTYYNKEKAELKIPTWYGVDLYAGSESMMGEKLNPEETNGRIYYAGVSLPLVQNLVIDKRRAALQQAKILRDQSQIARRAALNDLIAEAALSYWDWWEQYRVLQIVQASVKNAKERLAMVKIAQRLGDRPAIDTIEAATQLQTFEQQETEALMLFQKSRLQLSVFLWNDKGEAYELPEDVIPQVIISERPPLLDSILREALLQPLLVEYDFKLRGLEIERRLKFQSLLPEVTAKYNAISRELSNTFNHALFDNNFRFGITLSMPLRLSEGRGQYRASIQKIQQVELEQKLKQFSIQAKAKQYFIEWQQTLFQYEQQQRLVQNFLILQRGEETKFINGESSLFLINSREARTIEGQRKEISLLAKIQQSIVRLKWAAGFFSKL